MAAAAPAAGRRVAAANTISTETKTLVSYYTERNGVPCKFAVVLGDGKVVDLGNWSAGAEARAAVAALDAALEGRAPASESALAELFCNPQRSEEDTYARLVWTSDGGAAPLTDGSSPLLPQLSRSNGLVRTCDGRGQCAVLLAHDFAGGLRLTTLVDWAGGHPAMLRAAFADGATQGGALKPSGGGASHATRTFSDVAIDGVSLDERALGDLPKAQRTAVREALLTQLLLAARQCVTARWAGGLLALWQSDAMSAPALAVPLAALAAVLQRDAPGSGGSSVTPAVCQARTAQAEKLEEQGQYAQAAALYGQNLADDLRTRAREGPTSTGVLSCPPLVWSYYAIALRKSGRVSEAIAAFETGLRSLPGQLKPDTPQWREHLRILLLGLLSEAHHHAGKKTIVMETYKLIFSGPRELTLGHRATMRSLPCSVSGFMLYEFIVPSLRRSWRTVFGPDPLGRPENAGLSMYRIEEVAPPAALLNQQLTPREARAINSAEARQARQAPGMPDRRRYGATRSFPAAELPPIACHVCSATPAKHCGRCFTVAYCSKECQVADWSSHKGPCKEAVAAAEAEEEDEEEA